MCERSGSDEYELCEGDNAIQQRNCAWHRVLVEQSLSGTFLHHQSPEFLSHAYSRLPRYCNQTTFGQGPSNQTEFVSQNGYMHTSMSANNGSMSRSQRGNQTMTPNDWNYGSLDFPDPSVIGSNIWPGAAPTDGTDDNQASLQGMGNEIHLESFGQVPAANSPRTMLNIVSSSSCQSSKSVPMLFRSETCHVQRRPLRPPVSGTDR
jgi:hypothetical protein